MDIRARIAKAEAELEALEKAYSRALSAQSWSTKDGESQRSVSNVSLATLSAEIQRKKLEIENLERQLSKRGAAFFLGVKF